MPHPTDRGFVLVRTHQDGSHDVEIYTRRPGPGAEPFAAYSRVPRVIRHTAVDFVADGAAETSRRPLEVTWSSEDGAVYLLDETAGALRPAR